MKRFTILAVLFVTTLATAAPPAVVSDGNNAVMWTDTLSGAANKIATLCGSLNMPITDQTPNSITCSIEALSQTMLVNFTITRVANKVRVSWLRGARMTEEQARSMPADNSDLNKALKVGLTEVVTTGSLN